MWRKCSQRRFPRKLNMETEFKFKRSAEPNDSDGRPQTVSTENVSGLLIDPPGMQRRKAVVVTKGQVLYGVHPVAMALSQRKRIFHRLFLRNGAGRVEMERMASDCQVPITYVHGDRMLDSLTEDRLHQGVCMDVGPLDIPVENPDSCFDGMMNSNSLFPLWLLMENIKDPMNFGAILRSAHYFGVEKVSCSKRNSCKLSPVVSKASSGAMEVVPLSAIDSIPQFLQKAREAGWCIVGTGAHSAGHNIPLVEINSFHFRHPVLLILGNEGSGISDDVLGWCDVLLSIQPFQGESHPVVDCLNVSAAAAILFQILTRKRLGSV